MLEDDFLLIELLNRELREDLNIALMLISDEKKSFSNLNKYEEDKRLLFELIETDQIKIETVKKVRKFFSNKYGVIIFYLPFYTKKVLNTQREFH